MIKTLPFNAGVQVLGQILEGSCFPWLIAPSSIFKAINIASSHQLSLLSFSFTLFTLSPFCSPLCFPGGSDDKESACNAADLGSIPGLGRSPGEGNGYQLHYSCLGNLTDRGAWWARVQGITESRTQLSD